MLWSQRPKGALSIWFQIWNIYGYCFGFQQQVLFYYEYEHICNDDILRENYNFIVKEYEGVWMIFVLFSQNSTWKRNIAEMWNLLHSSVMK